MRFLLTTLLIAGSAAAAQTAAPRPMVSPACRTEIQTLCPKGDDRAARRQCLKSNRDKISEGCRAEIRAAAQARRAAGGGKRGMGNSGDMSAPGAMTTETAPK